jgi:hypothetical protein
VRSRQNEELRIAIEGRYLDEVKIRQANMYATSPIAYVSFPARRHWARAEGDDVTLSAQAATVVKLFADGVLPALGGRSVAVEVGGRIHRCILEAVELGATGAVDDMIVLRFRRSDEREA